MARSHLPNHLTPKRLRHLSQIPAVESEAWRLAGLAPPPEQLQIPDQQIDDTLNDAPLFCAENFKSTCPNERGRGAFAAAALCLLERTGVATGHVYAVRTKQFVDRWLLNRMPGRTQSLLQFVNGVVAGMLGLKPFTTWRALARSLGTLPSLCVRACACVCACARVRVCLSVCLSVSLSLSLSLSISLSLSLSVSQAVCVSL